MDKIGPSIPTTLNFTGPHWTIMPGWIFYTKYARVVRLIIMPARFFYINYLYVLYLVFSGPSTAIVSFAVAVVAAKLLIFLFPEPTLGKSVLPCDVGQG